MRSFSHPRGVGHHQEMANFCFIAGVLTHGSPGSVSTRLTNTRRNGSPLASRVNASA